MREFTPHHNPISSLILTNVFSSFSAAAAAVVVAAGTCAAESILRSRFPICDITHVELLQHARLLQRIHD